MDCLQTMNLTESSAAYFLEVCDRLPIKDSVFHICALGIALQTEIISILRTRGVKREAISVTIFGEHLSNPALSSLELEFIIQNCGLLCMNAMEYDLMSGILADSHISYPVTLISSGDAGAKVILLNDKTYFYESPKISVVNTIGAGDVLHGCFVSHRIIRTLESSLRKAVVTATRSCESFGLTHILTENESISW